MSSVIDLCDSSFEENDEMAKTPSRGSAAALARKTSAPSNFWDSSSDEEDDNSTLTTRKQKVHPRRKSTLVTPDDARRKGGPVLDGFSSHDEDEETQSFNQRAKRKHPRVLFSQPSKTVNLSATPKIEDESFGDSGDRNSSNKARFGDASSTSDDSDDDSIIMKTSGLTQTSTTIQTIPSNELIVMLDSSDEDEDTDKKPKAIPKTQLRNPYQRTNQKQDPKKFTIQSITAVSRFKRPLEYPSVGPRSSQGYEDLRAKYIIALWRYTRTLTSASYNLTKLDAYCRRINDLALCQEFPIRSLGEYLGDRYAFEQSSFKEALQVGGLCGICVGRRDPGVDGYCSVAQAALVGMLEYLEEKAEREGIDFKQVDQDVDFCKAKENWVFLKDLIPLIDSRLDGSLVPSKLGRVGDEDNGELFYTNPSTKSVEFKQVEQLTKKNMTSSMSLLRSHRKDKRLCFELTHSGVQKAQWLRERQFPATPSYLRTSRLYKENVDPSFEGIVLVVDNREGGGTTKKLHTMCQGLDMRKVPYIVTKLEIGDYAFVDMKTGKLLPILIERKSIQDVAQSIWDGRWTSQKRRMYHGQYVFGYEDCRLMYLIEGHADKQELTGGVIGQTQFNVNRTQLDSELANLTQEGFEVITTNNVNGSLAKLVELSKAVADDFRRGKYVSMYTYEAFMQRVRSIPSSVNFSKLARNCRPVTDPKEVDTSIVGEGAKEAKITTRPSILKTKLDPKLAERYKTWKVSRLKDECEKHGLPKTGAKAVLIDRLLGPHPPSEWLQRKKANMYIPSRHDTCASAILVSIWLHQRLGDDSWKGMMKEDIITLSESLDISRDPFTGTGKGTFNYDGWSCMGPLREGECPLVLRQKGGFYKLTSMGGDMSGMRIAAAMHEWCHMYGNCRCHDVGFS